MCSGLTAYAALKRLASRADRGPVLLVGLGGVGMMGLAMARALFRQPPIVADIDAEKRKAALAAGAAQPSIHPIRKHAGPIAAATGGVLAACDFVGSDQSLQFATGVLARGGKVVVTGLLGGTFSIAAAMFAIKAMTIEGTLTGSLAEARELLDLARSAAITPIPTRQRPFSKRKRHSTICAPAGLSAAPFCRPETTSPRNRLAELGAAPVRQPPRARPPATRA